MKPQYDVIVVGAGIAGVAAAKSAASGGRVLLLGDEDCLPYKRTSLSKHLATGFADDAFDLPLERVGPGLLAESATAGAVFEFRQGARIVTLDPEKKSVVLASGERLAAGSIVLACGSVAVGSDRGGRIRTVRGKADALALAGLIVPGVPVLVVGAGVLGVEIAAQLAIAGMRVVLSGRPGPVLSRLLDAASAALAEQALVRLGVEYRPGIEVDDLREEGGAVVAAGSGPFTLAVIAAGTRPATALAAAAGLGVDRGIVVNERLETTAPAIFAAGDCAEHPGGLVTGLWHQAEAQGRLAGLNALGGDHRYDRAGQRVKCSIGSFFVYSANFSGEKADSLLVTGADSRIEFLFRDDRLVSILAAGCDPALDKPFSAALAAGMNRAETEARFGWHDRRL